MNNELFAEQVWWYIARSGGMIALALAAASVIWGLMLSTKFFEGRPGPKWLLDLHKFLGALTVLFTLVHVVALMFDSYVNFSVVDILVPFASSWQPGAVAWGVVAFWLLLAVQGSSLVMHRIPRRWWRAIHFSSFGLLWAGVVHGFTAGTDADSWSFLLSVGGIGGLIVLLTGWRILGAGNRRRAIASQSAA